MKRTAQSIALAMSLGWAQAALSQTWINPGTGDWFDSTNWDTATVPGPGGIVTVSNGGIAQLSGVPSTPLLGSLSIGIGGTGTGSGTVQSTGVEILTTGGFTIGSSFGNTTPFVSTGALTITGAGAQGAATIGTITNTTAPGTATGTMALGGPLQLNNGFVQIGSVFDGAAGSTATGALTV
ncbi:MAG TPA: hypothetical protein VIG69_10025, partial [Candidatus Methylomirabilis sp.]